jgi:hypothetical protein
MKPEDSLPHSQALANCPILNHMNPVRASLSHFLKIHFNIILLLKICIRCLFWELYKTHTYTPYAQGRVL